MVLLVLLKKIAQHTTYTQCPFWAAYLHFLRIEVKKVRIGAIPVRTLVRIHLK